MDSLLEHAADVESLAVLSRFRLDFHRCLTARRDELFELADAVLCADGPVRTLAGLSLAPEHRRGHGALYDAVNYGEIAIGRLRRSLAGLPLPRAADGRLMLAADVSNWLRPGAATSPERLFCHVYGRGKGQAQMIPGWPYSVIAALEPGRTSWTAVLDAVRLGPDNDGTEVTAAQVRDLVTRLIEAGHWGEGDPAILVVFDAGYDVTRLAYLLADLPVDLLGRLRSDRVMQLPAPPRQPGTVGRPRKHGGELALADPATWPAPQTTTSTLTARYGMAVTAAWDRVHPRLTHRAAWLDHDGDLPVLEGTLIRLQVDHLPGDRDPKPVWLWFSRTGALPGDVDRLWQSFLRRFDLEHTFRLFKQVLGWTIPKIRDPRAADRWTWLIIAVHAQLRLARPLADDLRLPWERPALPGRLTPARVRRGFRNIRAKAVQPAGAPKPSKPGPGRPPGSKNRRPAPRHDVGKTTKRQRTVQSRAKAGRLNDKLRGYARSCMRGRIDRPSTNCLGGDSGVVESWPSVRVEHVEFSGVGDAAEVGALLSVRAFVSLGELTPDDVHVQVLHGKIDSNDVLTGVTVQDLDLAESYDGGRYRFNGPIVLDRGGAFGYTVRVIPRNDLLTSVAEPGVVAVA